MKNLKWIVLFLVLPSVVMAGGIAQRFGMVPPDERKISPKSRKQFEIPASEHKVSEIGMERGLLSGKAMGASRSFGIVFEQDGSVAYEDVHNGPYKGKRTGKINRHAYNRLAQYIRSINYEDLDNYYGDVVTTGQPTVFTTAFVNGRRKVIANLDDRAPQEVWVLEQLIDHFMMTEVNWDKE